jgi:succinate dehydrogenase / fumarate reductase flavoprotein subunit
VIPGIYAAGECACVSVHGANRLGTNSLVDLVVFGKRSGKHAAEYVKTVDYPPLPEDAAATAIATVETMLSREGKESVATIREEMQKVMMDRVGVFREEPGIKQAIAKIGELKERYCHVTIQDKGKRFNTDLLEAWELGCLLDLAQLTAEAALARTESRGAHSREDYKQRNDTNWLKHSLAWLKEGGDVELRYKPVTIIRYEPKERVY